MRSYEVFLGAAAVIKQRGHAKRVLEDASGAVCLSGAFRAARYGNPCAYGGEFVPRDMSAVADIVYPNAGDGEWEAVRWNNADERTPEDVIAALDAAAVVAMQEAGLEPEDVL